MSVSLFIFLISSIILQPSLYSFWYSEKKANVKKDSVATYQERYDFLSSYKQHTNMKKQNTNTVVNKDPNTVLNNDPNTVMNNDPNTVVCLQNLSDLEQEIAAGEEPAAEELPAPE